MFYLFPPYALELSTYEWPSFPELVSQSAAPTPAQPNTLQREVLRP